MWEQSATADREYQVWERNPLSVPLFTQKVVEQKINYIHNNPVNPRWNLAENPEDYKYSSAKFYYSGIHEFVRRGGSLNITLMFKGGSFIKGWLLVAKKFVRNYFYLKSANKLFEDQQRRKFLAGSQFCNNGGRIAGNGQLTFGPGYHYVCNELENFNFKDSAKLVLSDSAILEIPDSNILLFTGKQAGLVMNPHSKLKIGIGSKIIFDSSASIYADGAEFSSDYYTDSKLS